MTGWDSRTSMNIFPISSSISVIMYVRSQIMTIWGKCSLHNATRRWLPQEKVIWFLFHFPALERLGKLRMNMVGDSWGMTRISILLSIRCRWFYNLKIYPFFRPVKSSSVIVCGLIRPRFDAVFLCG